MASKCNRLINKRSISSLKSAIKSSTSKSSTTPTPSFSLPSSPFSRFHFSRIRSELGAVQSLMPLHNAVATARMTSCLVTSSRTCIALSQDEIDGT